MLLRFAMDFFSSRLIRWQGVDNVYAQHIPLIKDLLEQLLRGKLKDTLYPSVTARDPISTSSSNQLAQQGQVNK